MKRTILWTQTTTYASDVQVTVAQVARWAAGSALLRTNSPGQSRCHPSPAQVEKMMAANEQFSAFITAAYCQDLGLLRSVDATIKGTGAPTVVEEFSRRPGHAPWEHVEELSINSQSIWHVRIVRFYSCTECHAVGGDWGTCDRRATERPMASSGA